MLRKAGSDCCCGYTCGLLLFVFGFICTAVGTAYCFKQVLRVLGGILVAIGALLTIGGITVCICLKRTSSKQLFLDDNTCQQCQVPPDEMVIGTLPRQTVPSKYINQQHLQMEQQNQQPGMQKERPGEQSDQQGKANEQPIYSHMPEVYSEMKHSDETQQRRAQRQHRAAYSEDYDRSMYTEQRRAAYTHQHHTSAPNCHQGLSYSHEGSPRSLDKNQRVYVRNHSGEALSAQSYGREGAFGQRGEAVYAQVTPGPSSAPSSAMSTPQHPSRSKPPPRVYLQAEHHQPAAQPLILQPDAQALEDCSIPPSYDVASYYSPRKT